MPNQQGLKAWTLRNPFDEKVLASQALDSRAQWQNKLSALHLSFLALRERTWEERVGWLEQWAENLEAEAESLARMISEEMGKPLNEARQEIRKSVAGMRRWREIVATWYGQIQPQVSWPSPYDRSEVRLQGLGIIFGIMPWNFPIWQTVRLALSTLTVGNTLLIKPAENTYRSTARLLALLPKPAEKIVGETVFVDHAAVAEILADPRVQGVSLTGSPQAGRSVAALAGQNLKKSVLELGGLDAYLIFADVDLDWAAKLARDSRLVNGGQSCIAGKRFYVEASVAEMFCRKLQEQISGLVMGDPTLEATQLGPLVSARALATLKKQVAQLQACGGQEVYSYPEDRVPKQGYFFSPKILFFKSLEGFPTDEEVFGPLFSVIAFASEEELEAHLQGGVFGLGAGVLTADSTRAERWLNRLEAGQVVHNDYIRSDVGLPFGGIRHSGYGRELSFLSLFEFANIKTVSYGSPTQTSS